MSRGLISCALLLCLTGCIRRPQTVEVLPSSVTPAVETLADETGAPVLNLHWSGRGMVLRMRAEPAKDPDHVLLHLIAPGAGGTDCSLTLTAGGQDVPVDGARCGRGTIEARIPAGLLTRGVEEGDLAAHGYGMTWQADGGGLAALRTFVKRLRPMRLVLARRPHHPPG